jgi:hypothetical protein
MRRAKKRPGLLVALEIGAEWPARAVAARGDAVRRVVSQNEGETPEAFAARLGALAGGLFASDVALRGAIFACNERTDSSASLARRAGAALVLERLGPLGTLVFAAGERAGGRLRHALSALAIDLAPEASATVTVHFDAEASGVRATGERTVARVA